METAKQKGEKYIHDRIEELSIYVGMTKDGKELVRMALLDAYLQGVIDTLRANLAKK